MSIGCSDVCEVVHERLAKLGFVISENEEHDDILEALDKVSFGLEENAEDENDD